MAIRCDVCHARTALPAHVHEGLHGGKLIADTLAFMNAVISDKSLQILIMRSSTNVHSYTVAHSRSKILTNRKAEYYVECAEVRPFSLLTMQAAPQYGRMLLLFQIRVPVWKWRCKWRIPAVIKFYTSFCLYMIQVEKSFL